MGNWDSVSDRVLRVRKDNPTWKSQTNSLFAIFHQAEEWDIDPGKVENASMSNLCEIIPEARKAIRRNNRERLKTLFGLASELPNRQLRLRLRGDDRQEIIVQRIIRNHNNRFLIDLPEDQFNRIAKAMEQAFEFRIEEEI
jgi:hypothetical protein